MSLPLVLPSEDLLHWNPAKICRHPQPPGPEDAWCGRWGEAAAGAGREGERGR